MAKKKKANVVLTPEQQLEADYQKAVRRMEGAPRMLQTQDQIHMYKEAINMFTELGDYADCQKRKQECRKRIPPLREQHREEIYQNGCRLMEKASSASDYDAAIAEFQRLRHIYKDIPELIERCREEKRKAKKMQKKRRILLRLTAAAVLASMLGVIWYLRTPSAFYLEGRVLMGIRDYERARNVLVHSKGYRDTDERLLECNYQRAIHCEQEGDYVKAVKILDGDMADYKDSRRKKALLEQRIYSTAEVGTEVTFGKIRWIIADSQDDQVLLVRRTPAYEDFPYDKADGPTTWADSDMRRWLNRKFYKSCFTDDEQALIVTQQIATADNSRFGTAGGKTVNDAVFLLDEAQAGQYRDVLTRTDNQRAWWLRTPGQNTGSAAYVSADGRVMSYGYETGSADLGIRPAVWVTRKIL